MQLLPSNKPSTAFLMPPDGKALRKRLLEVLSSQPGPQGERLKRGVAPTYDELEQLVRVTVPRGPFRLCLQDNQQFREEIRSLVHTIRETSNPKRVPKLGVAPEVYVAEAKAVGAGVYRAGRGSEIGSSAAFRDTVEELKPYVPLLVLLAIGGITVGLAVKFANDTSKMMEAYANGIDAAANGNPPERLRGVAKKRVETRETDLEKSKTPEEPGGKKQGGSEDDNPTAK